MIPIFKPYMPPALPELNDILYSGNLSYGKWGKQFESKLSSYIGAEYVMVTNSYNSAMLIMLTTLGLSPGDVVLASPMSCLASNQPFITQNLKVKWVDIDPATGSMDPDSLVKAIDSNCKAIFHNHFCGTPGYIDEINKIASEHGLVVVDDCIEAFGSKYKGKMMGNVGTDASVFSFQTVRLPNTVDGGAIAFKSAKMFERALRIRDYGINRATFRDCYNEISVDSDIEIGGYGALMPEINSYIGYEQMGDLPLLISKQRENAVKWQSYLTAKYPNDKIIGFSEDIDPNFWVIGLLCNNKQESLKHFRNIGYYATGVHISNNHYSVFGDQQYLAGVSDFENKFLALPTGWWIEDLSFD
ncbi:DegT/DnrJ/EryC1/StrS family aminotransferase [Mucilaginibacter jinjuensis]|uniref:Aminotransferase class I/II-fold pyridoxal phosphate-dependent enzyme n=1 Tax=Mucilaginibacter jinjuensis TaxID=1176721 RepID=A0ABY7T9Y9_9SPHI|nr:aminotransferase class I/II-fold pyridoxal phosphate-dependent enzyme [Mucilaginibacter jinjuensis]WCT13157.1 aminotransferase class I/II-fold pyridoxal phosphate-dependent enzyme [Mucilaginibacter jinjuensis]